MAVLVDAPNVRLTPGSDDAWRPPVATLGELPSTRVTVSPELPVFEVERMFLGEPTLSAMVVSHAEEAVCISRDWFFSQLVGPLGHGRSLYARHRIGRLPRPDTLVLPAAMTPIDAASEVQKRPLDSRYHDIVIRHAEGEFSTIAVADLFAEVAHTHAYLGLHDPLTALANRRMFLERLRATHARASGGADGLFAVLFVDLDDFKPINDVLGHETGDVALITVAQRLQQFESRPITVARFGGDEFGVLVEEGEEADAILDLADRIATSLNEPMLLAGERVTLGASIGVALSDGVSSPENLLRNADLAMYVAKRDRKGQYALFESDMHARASKRLQLRSQLEVALEEEQFELFFQPVVELDDLRIVGCEALLRWQQPGRGLIGPNQFIGLCEQTGMILPLGSWVLRTACTRGARWRREHPDYDEIFLSVNISPRQLLQDGFVDEVARVLRDTGAVANNLVLEITENVFIEDFTSVTERLQAIRQLGVQVALDDFGSGFSSLGYLSRLPIDVLKLDRRFVSQLGETSERGLLSGIVGLTHSLNLIAVAEGVETREQLEELRLAGCERGQGYLFAAPMNGDGMTAMLDAVRAQPELLSVA
jgi:diguanylate cyclase (GGDEF)-like protein